MTFCVCGFLQIRVDHIETRNVEVVDAVGKTNLVL